MRIPSSSAAASPSTSSVAQWQQRALQAQVQQTVSNVATAPPKPPAGTGQYVNVVA